MVLSPLGKCRVTREEPLKIVHVTNMSIDTNAGPFRCGGETSRGRIALMRPRPGAASQGSCGPPSAEKRSHLTVAARGPKRLLHREFQDHTCGMKTHRPHTWHHDTTTHVAWRHYHLHGMKICALAPSSRVGGGDLAGMHAGDLALLTVW